MVATLAELLGLLIFVNGSKTFTPMDHSYQKSTVEETIKFMREAIRLSIEPMEAGLGGPFGAVIVKDGEMVGYGYNQVTERNDPTAHAEIVAIRSACARLSDFALTGCEIYCSCEPCPMCLSAIYWARISKIYYANISEQASAAGFDDSWLYRELTLPLASRRIPSVRILSEEALIALDKWQNKADKVPY